MTARVLVRPLDPASGDEIALIARRMRSTLVEVLGPKRGRRMYTLDWLRRRVRYHLNPKRDAAVFVARASGSVIGHTIVRVESDGGGRFGLFATTYVAPTWRHCGVADKLLRRGERWMRARRLRRAATYTSQTNAKLIGLYEKDGYTINAWYRGKKMVELGRTLS